MNVYPRLDASFQTNPSAAFHGLRPSSLEQKLLNTSSSFPPSYLLASDMEGAVLPRQGHALKGGDKVGSVEAETLSLSPGPWPESPGIHPPSPSIITTVTLHWLPKLAPLFPVPAGYWSAKAGLGRGAGRPMSLGRESKSSMPRRPYWVCTNY